MSKWKEIKTYTEVNPYNGQPADEAAPANSVAREKVQTLSVQNRSKYGSTMRST